jgi:hypothetical protein
MLGVYLISSAPIVHVTPLKTPFGLLIPLLQSQSHVTTITHNYFAVTRLHNYNPYTFVTAITYYTLTHLHWLTSPLSITVSNYHTLPVSVSYRDLTRRTAPYKLTLYRRGPSGYLLCTDPTEKGRSIVECSFTELLHSNGHGTDPQKTSYVIPIQRFHWRLLLPSNEQ